MLPICQGVSGPLRARFKADSREVEMKQLQKRAVVEGAITRGKIRFGDGVEHAERRVFRGNRLLAKTGKV
jgi:hypothetical protein